MTRKLLVISFIISVLNIMGLSLVYADKPEFFDVPFESSRIDTTTCNFPVEEHITGIASFTLHISHDQTAVRGNRHMGIDVIYTNLMTGTSVRAFGHRGSNLIWDIEPPVFNDDGSVSFHDHFAGLSTLIVLPGTGPLVLDTGVLDVYTTIAADGTELSHVGEPMAGHWDRHLSPAICAALQ